MAGVCRPGVGDGFADGEAVGGEVGGFLGGSLAADVVEGCVGLAGRGGFEDAEGGDEVLRCEGVPEVDGVSQAAEVALEGKGRVLGEGAFGEEEQATEDGVAAEGEEGDGGGYAGVLIGCFEGPEDVGLGLCVGAWV